MNNNKIQKKGAGLEKKLYESEKLYRNLVETTGTGYVIIDSKGRVIDANPEYVRLTGHRSLKDIIGRSVIEWTADYEKKKNAEAVALCAKQGYIRNLEIDYIDKTGKITPIEINATVVERNGMPQILTICRDITERRKMERILQEKVHELERLNKLMIGRELKMIELKNAVQQLKRRK